MQLIVVLLASLLTKILAGWETPLLTGAKVRMCMRGELVILQFSYSRFRHKSARKSAKVPPLLRRGRDAQILLAWGVWCLRLCRCKAYAPIKGRVAKFLAVEAQAEKPCPRCDDKDYSDM